MQHKFGGKVYNGLNVPSKISPELIISAFANPIDDSKVEYYTHIMSEKMLSHDFPPISGYPTIIDENDVGDYFLTGEEITDNHIGQQVWVVTDGHHRTLAAIAANLPFIETELDYSTVTNLDEYYEEGGKVNIEDELKSMITPEMISELKQLVDTHYSQKIAEYKSQLEKIMSDENEINKKIDEIWEVEKQLLGEEKYSSFRERNELYKKRDSNVPLKRYLTNKIKALENKGTLVSVTDKKGLEYNEIPDFSNIKAEMLAFDEDEVLNNEMPAYVPEIDFEKYRIHSYMFDAIRLAPDKYIMATNSYVAREITEENNYTPEKFSEINGYVIVSLDQLVLINNYYFTVAKAKLNAEAEEKSLRNKEYWYKQSEQSREKFLNQVGLYHSLPAKIRKTITQEQYAALSWQEKEKIYQFYKRYSGKRITSKLEENSMWASFHNMYERFIDPNAVMPKPRYAHPNAWKYWELFRDFLKWKIKDLKIQNEENSESYKKAIETAFGIANSDETLFDEYGILVKRQDGSKITPTEINQIKNAWIVCNKIIGNMKTVATIDKLKISHTKEKHVFASKAIGVYVPQMQTIAVSNKFGDNQFVYTMAHELAHWIDNILGKKVNKGWITNDYESTAGKIAFDFRKNMNRKVDSEYANQTKECFARAIEQYLAIEKNGYEAETSYIMYEADKNKSAMPYITSDYYVNKDAYDNIIKPQIEQFLSENKEIFSMENIIETDIKTPDITDEKKYYNLALSFMSKSQKSVIKNSDEYDEIINELGKQINDMPVSYQTDGQGKNAIAYLHYFRGGSDWYITEKDIEKKQLQAFGYVVLNNDYQFAEFGYINIEELKENNVELDLFWTPKTINEIIEEKTDGKTDVNSKEKISEEQIQEMEVAEYEKQKSIYENESSTEEERNIAFKYLVENDWEFADTQVGNVKYQMFHLTEPYKTIGVFPQMNKNNTIDEYRHEYEISDEKRKANAHQKCKIIRAIMIGNKDFIVLSNTLLYQGLGAYEPEVGGTSIDDLDIIAAGYDIQEFNKKLENWSFSPEEEAFARKHMYDECGIVINVDTNEHYLYNTEGYDYVRYAGWIAKDADDAVNEIKLLLTPLQTENTTSEPAVTVNEMEMLQKEYETVFEETKKQIQHFLKQSDTVNKSIEANVKMVLNNLYEPKFSPFLKQTLEYQMSLPKKVRIMLDWDYISHEIINNNIWNYIPSEFKKIPSVSKVPYNLNYQDKGLAKIIKPFTGKDELRLSLLGVNFDKHGVTATDAQKMIFIKGKVADKGLYCMHPSCYKIAGKDEITDSDDKFVKFPDYSQVIPLNTQFVTINIKPFLLYVETIREVKFSAVEVSESIVIYTGGEKNENDSYIIVNGEFISDVLTALLQMGYEKVDMSFSHPNRAILFTPIGNVELAPELKTNFILLMPIMKTYGYSGLTDTEWLKQGSERNYKQSYYNILNESIGMLGTEAPEISINETNIAIEAATEKANKIIEIQKDEANKKIAEVNKQLLELENKKQQLDSTIDAETRKKNDTEKSTIFGNYSVLRYLTKDGVEAIRVQNLSVDEEIDNPEIYRMNAGDYTNTEAVEIAKRIFEDRRSFAEKTEKQRIQEEEQSIDDLKVSLENAIIAMEFVDNEEEKKELQDYIDGLKTIIEIGI